MILYFDLDLGRLIHPEGSANLLETITLQRSAGDVLTVHFLRNGQKVTLASTFEIQFIAKANGDFSGDAVILATLFTLDTATNTYKGAVNSITEELDALLLVGTANEKAELEIDAQLAMRETDSAEWQHSQVLACMVKNSIHRGAETPATISNLQLSMDADGHLIIVYGGNSYFLTPVIGSP